MCARKLYRCRDKITLLLYRREELEQWVKTVQVEALLKEIGYDSVELHRIFRKLEQRIGGHGNGEMPFPHEMCIRDSASPVRLQAALQSFLLP